MGDSKSPKNSDVERPRYIFKGQYISDSEIQIEALPIFHDALRISHNPTFIYEHPYHYLNLKPKKPIHFTYFDGLEKQCGWITLKGEEVLIMTDQLGQRINIYLLMKKGKDLSFITLFSNHKIRNRSKDLCLKHSERKKQGE